MPQPRQLYSTPQAARALGNTTDEVAEYVLDGALASVIVDKEFYVPRAELRRVLKNRHAWMRQLKRR